MIVDSNKIFHVCGVQGTPDPLPCFSVDTVNAFMGLGTIAPTYKAHISSSANTGVYFGGTSTQGAAITIDSITARHSYVSYVNNGTLAWNAGNYTGNRADNGGRNSFIWSTGGFSVSSQDIKGELTTGGNMNIRGGFYTDNNYSQGKFVSIYSVAKTSTQRYFPPMTHGLSDGGGYNQFTDTGINFDITPFSGRLIRTAFLANSNALPSSWTGYLLFKWLTASDFTGAAGALNSSLLDSSSIDYAAAAGSATGPYAYYRFTNSSVYHNTVTGNASTSNFINPSKIVFDQSSPLQYEMFYVYDDPPGTHNVANFPQAKITSVFEFAVS
jgi:hypothetical protein